MRFFNSQGFVWVWGGIPPNSPGVSAADHLHICISTLLCVHVYISLSVFLNHFCSQDIVIQQDDEIRLRIVGTRVDAKDIVSTDMSCIAVCLCPCTAQHLGQNSLLLQSGCLTYQAIAQLIKQTFCPIKQVCSYEKSLPAKISFSHSTFFKRDLKVDHYLSAWQV